MEELNKFITLREAAQISGYSQDYLGQLIRSTKLDGKKVGKSWVTTQENLNRYLQAAGLMPPDKVPGFFESSAFKRMAISFLMAVLLSVVGYSIYLGVYQYGYSQATQTVSPVNVSTSLDDQKPTISSTSSQSTI